MPMTYPIYACASSLSDTSPMVPRVTDPAMRLTKPPSIKAPVSQLVCPPPSVSLRTTYRCSPPGERL